MDSCTRLVHLRDIDHIHSVSRKEWHFLEEVGVFLAEYGENQFILREHPIWMAEEEIESGIYEMCDMLLLTKEVSIKKYRAEAGYHDVLQAVYQGKSSYR